MPSYRYTRDIGPEDVRPPEIPRQTTRQKCANWLHYHWKPLVCIVFILVAVGLFFADIARQEKTDLGIAILSPIQLPDALSSTLSEGIAAGAGTGAGTSTASVSVEVFTVQFAQFVDNAAGPDPYAQMAGLAKLTTALDSGEVMLFLVREEDVAELQQNYGIFCRPDGTSAQPGDGVPELTLAWETLPGLRRLALPLPLVDGGTFDGQALLAGYRLGLRGIEGTKLEGKTDAETHWQNALDALTRWQN